MQCTRSTWGAKRGANRWTNPQRFLPNYAFAPRSVGVLLPRVLLVRVFDPVSQ